MNLFENTPIRSCSDISTHSSSGKHWFSAIDICAALRGCDYQTARNYWKWLKAKLFTSQPVSTTNQLKMQAQDGKLRYTDVVDAEGVLQMIQLCPSPKASAFRAWVAELISDIQVSDSQVSDSVPESKSDSKSDCNPVIKRLEEVVVAAKDKVRTSVGKLLKTIRMTDFCLFDEGYYEENIDDTHVSKLESACFEMQKRGCLTHFIHDIKPPQASVSRDWKTYRKLSLS